MYFQVAGELCFSLYGLIMCWRMKLVSFANVVHIVLINRNCVLVYWNVFVKTHPLCLLQKLQKSQFTTKEGFFYFGMDLL